MGQLKNYDSMTDSKRTIQKWTIQKTQNKMDNSKWTIQKKHRRNNDDGHYDRHRKSFHYAAKLLPETKQHAGYV